MAIIARSFPRVTRVHLPSLIEALTPLMGVVSGHAFHVDQNHSHVRIRQGDWFGVDLVAVQNAVTSAPIPNNNLRKEDLLRDIPREYYALFAVIGERLNPPLTVPQLIQLASQKDF